MKPGPTHGEIEIVDVCQTTIPDPSHVCATPLDDFDPTAFPVENPLHPFDHVLHSLDQDRLLADILEADPESTVSSRDVHLLSSVSPTHPADFVDECCPSHDEGQKFTEALVHMACLTRQHDGDLVRAYKETQRSDPTWQQQRRAHFDGGSMATTTHDESLVWYRRRAVNPPILRVADKRAHRPTHQGFLRVPTSHGTKLIPTFLTPTLPATIMSPDSACRHFRCQGYTAISNCDGHNCSLTLRHCQRTNGDIHLPAVLRRGLLYSQPLLAPQTEADRTGPPPRAALPSCLRTPLACVSAVSSSSPSLTVEPASSCAPSSCEEGTATASTAPISSSEEGLDSPPSAAAVGTSSSEEGTGPPPSVAEEGTSPSEEGPIPFPPPPPPPAPPASPAPLPPRRVNFLLPLRFMRSLVTNLSSCGTNALVTSTFDAPPSSIATFVASQSFPIAMNLSSVLSALTTSFTRHRETPPTRLDVLRSPIKVSLSTLVSSCNEVPAIPNVYLDSKD